MIFEMVLSKNMFCWKNSLATHVFPTQQKSIILCDVDVSCICTHGRCHVMLTSLALTHMVRAARCWPNVFSSAAWPAVSPEIGPRFPRHGGRKSGLDFRQNPSAGNRCPIWAAHRGNRALPFGCKVVRLQLCQIRVASTAIHHHLLHSHRLRPRPDQIQTPNGPFGFWILDFGVWILDQFSLCSFCGGPKRRRLDFGVWILGLD